jgi:hypothetical protein
MPRSNSPNVRNTKTVPVSFNKNIPAITSQRPSFLDTMKDGLSFGIGNSLGHRVVGAILGPSTVQIPTVPKKNEEYEQCIKDTNDKTGCEYLLSKQ